MSVISILREYDPFDHTRIDAMLLLYSWLEPILQPQTGDVPEIRRIVRYESNIINEGHRADHQIDRRNLNAASPEFNSDSAKHVRTIHVEVEHPNFSQEHFINILQDN